MGVFAVELVVRRHHRPRLAFLDGNLEVFQIEFPQGTVAYLGIVLQTVDFLVVGGKVLDGSSHAIRLDATHVCGSHFARKQRVFRVILEIAPAERIAVQVHARGEEHIDTVFQYFIAHGGGHGFHQFRIP